MRKNRSHRRASHRRTHNSRHHKTYRRHRGGNIGEPPSVASSLYKPVSAVAREPVLLADKVGKNVSDSIKQAQVSLLLGQHKAKEQGKKVGEAIKGFGQSITDTISSWFGGGGSRKRRNVKGKRSRNHRRRYRKGGQSQPIRTIWL